MKNYYTFDQELAKLRAEEQQKAMLYDKSIGDGLDRPSDEQIEESVGAPLSEQDMKWKALQATNEKVLAEADKMYFDKQKSPEEEHIDQAIERYKDKEPQEEQGHDEQSHDRDDEQER